MHIYRRISMNTHNFKATCRATLYIKSSKNLFITTLLLINTFQGLPVESHLLPYLCQFCHGLAYFYSN